MTFLVWVSSRCLSQARSMKVKSERYNGKSLGIQIVPSYRYELSSYVKDGENEIAIEVATTL